MNSLQVILRIFLVSLAVTPVDGCRKNSSSADRSGEKAKRAVTGTQASTGSQEYSDSEVEAWRSTAPKVVPRGQSLPQAKVLGSMGIDQTRLRDHRVVGSFNSVIETWRVSESYDIEWMSDARDAHQIGSDGRQIYGVQILPRAKQYP
jgi:hypothetical protein